MGDPKFPRKKYDTPSHPWQGDRINAENELIKKFGLKNKREVWKAQSKLRRFRQQARHLNARLRLGDIQAEREKDLLLNKLVKLGLLQKNADLNDVLILELEKILNNRLQTQVYLKGLAHSTKQARQFIVHGHISIGGRKVTIPGYLVKREEEPTIEYNPYSSLTNELHPMRPKPKTGTVVSDSQVSRQISIEAGTQVKSGTPDEIDAKVKGADSKEGVSAPKQTEIKNTDENRVEERK